MPVRSSKPRESARSATARRPASGGACSASSDREARGRLAACAPWSRVVPARRAAERDRRPRLRMPAPRENSIAPMVSWSCIASRRRSSSTATSAHGGPARPRRPRPRPGCGHLQGRDRPVAVVGLPVGAVEHPQRAAVVHDGTAIIAPRPSARPAAELVAEVGAAVVTTHRGRPVHDLPAEPTSGGYDQAVDGGSPRAHRVAQHDPVLAVRFAHPGHIDPAELGHMVHDPVHGDGLVEQAEDLAVSLGELEQGVRQGRSPLPASSVMVSRLTPCGPCPTRSCSAAHMVTWAGR